MRSNSSREQNSKADAVQWLTTSCLRALQRISSPLSTTLVILSGKSEKRYLRVVTVPWARSVTLRERAIILRIKRFIII